MDGGQFVIGDFFSFPAVCCMSEVGVVDALVVWWWPTGLAEPGPRWRSSSPGFSLVTPKVGMSTCCHVSLPRTWQGFGRNSCIVIVHLVAATRF